MVLWEDFASALGISPEDLRKRQGKPKTRQALGVFKALMADYGTGAAAMYAFEKPIPEIASVKKEGLNNFYGINKPKDVQYFDVHATVDVEHAHFWSNELVAMGNEKAVMDACMRSMDAQHMLLDACLEV